jgi:uncharacterized protein
VGDLIRLDAWQNESTGFGTSRDKTTYSVHVRDLVLSDNELESLYAEDDLCALVVDLVPDEMLREGYDLEAGADSDGDEDDEADRETGKAICEALEELDAHDKLTQTDVWARLYGGAVLVLGVDDGAAAHTPLRPERARRLDWLLPIDRRFVTPHTFYSKGPKAREPETYYIQQPGVLGVPSKTFVIHESRLIIFRGARTSFYERQRRNYWDNSVLLRPYRTVRSFATGFKAVEILLTDGPSGVLKIKNLRDYLGGAGRAALEKRMAELELMRSVVRGTVVDSEESYERMQFSWAGIQDVLDRLMLRLSSAVRIPVTILMGQSPAGMNATGESDFRWFYDQVKARQVSTLEPRIKRLIRVLCATKEGPTAGKVPESIKLKWRPLWRPTALEQAQIRKAHADEAAVYVNADVITPEEVAISPNFPSGYSINRKVRLEALKKLSEAEQPPAQELTTPTDAALGVTVDELRASKGLGPDPDPEFGKLKVYQAKLVLESEKAEADAERQAEAAAAAGVDPNAPSSGGPPGAPPPPKGSKANAAPGNPAHVQRPKSKRAPPPAGA